MFVFPRLVFALGTQSMKQSFDLLTIMTKPIKQKSMVPQCFQDFIDEKKPMLQLSRLTLKGAHPIPHPSGLSDQ